MTVILTFTQVKMHDVELPPPDAPTRGWGLLRGSGAAPHEAAQSADAAPAPVVAHRVSVQDDWARRAAPETAPAMSSLRSSRVECREMTIALRPNRLGCNLLAPSYYSPEPLYL